MAYFNHSFTKLFLGIGATKASNPTTSKGFITQTGVNMGAANATDVALSNLTPGYFGIFDPKTYQTINVGLSTYECCPIMIASSSVLANDKIGPFHGGYRETNKSKVINPKYVQAAYKVETCVPQQAVVSVGVTPATGAGVATLDAGSLVAGTSYTNGTICAVTGGSGTGAIVQVTTAVSPGPVTAVTLLNGGIGYTAGDTLTIDCGTGDATIDIQDIAVTEVNNYQSNTYSNGCQKDFLCGETYYLRIDVKGSPALRALNHNAYQTLSAYTGCCAGPTPTVVDPTLVYIEWAKALVINNYLKPFVLPVVFDTTGTAWYAPGTTVDPISGAAVPSTAWWDNYVSPAGPYTGLSAGIRLIGAYVETKFLNCTFQITDFFEKEPVRIYASLVDYNGDPCVFEGLCVYNECRGIQGMGFGEQVVRDLILSQSYLQNFFATDLRIREITQGNQMLDAGGLDRNALYTRYFLLHSVPRFNNPTGVFDNDRYMLEIIVNEANPLAPVGITQLDNFLGYWLGSCANCVPFETQSCERCEIVPSAPSPFVV